MINKNVKYYKHVDGKAVIVNPSDYIMKFFCGNLHWINLVTGKEEQLFTKLEDGDIILNENIMEIETLVFFQDEATEVVEWKQFSVHLNEIKAYYSMDEKVTRIVIGAGEFDIAMPYDQLKKLKDIAYHHSTLIKFN